MSKEKNPLDILAQGTPSPVAPAPVVVDEFEELTPQRVREEKEALELEELREKRAEIKEARRVALEARRQNALQLDKARQEQETIQRLCPHLKPNGQPAIAGQRDHQHHYIFICAYCSKTFNEHTLSPHLRIPAERVGGPEF